MIKTRTIPNTAVPSSYLFYTGVFNDKWGNTADVNVSDALIAAGLSRPVSLSLADGSTSVTLISPYEILYQERADDLEQRGIETVLTSEGVLRPSVAVNKMMLEWTVVPVLNFLPKDQVLL